MKHIRLNALVVLILVSDYVLKKVDGSDGDFSVNVAYGKPANQSSTYIGNPVYGEPNGFPYIATLAVDGIKNNNFHGGSCSHTNVGQSDSWWEVDLQGLYDVSSIKIYQRVDANPNSLEGFVVEGLQSDAKYYTIDHSEPYSAGEITISLQPKRKFKSIRIQLHKNNALICLCEVEVFAEVNVALGKSAFQSSTYDGSKYSYGNERGLYNASLAVDGNTNTNFSSASCSQTTPNRTTLAWWKVTLNGPYAVIGLRIYQRTDGSNNKWLFGYKLYGRLGNNRYEEITIPTYQPGVINISLQHVKIFSEIKVELNVEDFRGICLCEVQVFAGMMCPDPPSIRNNSSREFFPGVAGYESFGSSVLINCVKGYMLNGSKSVQCTEYNVWNGQLGNCIDIDECRRVDSACHNHGRCTNTIGGFSCQCRNGYTGLTCEKDIDECKTPDSACYNGGRCINTDGSFSCECGNGYTGFTCDTDINECNMGDSACHKHGQCTNTVGGFSCQCTSGYTGLTCETDIDECRRSDSACHNHAQCTNTDGGFTCQCRNGYTGLTCETDIDECRRGDSACHNHGSCTNTIGGFSCQCRNGYTGLTCEKDIDECKMPDSACHNHGRCTNTDGGFSCECANGYTGFTCETDIDECSQEGICQYHGQCSNTDGSFTCNCSAGYKGKTCENDIDECILQNSTCNNHGQCLNIEGSFICRCNNSYTGSRCETDIDECTMQDSACHNHGQCSNTEGSFECQCSNGYLGATCETALHEMNGDQEQSKTCLLGWVITGPLCLILLVTNIVTCLRLRMNESFKRKKRNNIPDDITTTQKVNARDHRAQAKVNEGISAYEFVEDSYMETRKNKSNGSENNAMEPYDTLQMETRSKSEYDKLTFERESSLKTT